jgi:hypothetical protein
MFHYVRASIDLMSTPKVVFCFNVYIGLAKSSYVPVSAQKLSQHFRFFFEKKNIRLKFVFFLEKGRFINFSVRYIEVIHPPEKNHGLCQTTHSQKITVFLDLRTLRAANPKTRLPPKRPGKNSLGHLDQALRRRYKTVPL